MPDELYWRLTPPETAKLLEEIEARERRREEAADRRAAFIAATIINSNPYRKKGAKRVTVNDLLRDPKEKPTPEKMEAFAASFGTEPWAN